MQGKMKIVVFKGGTECCEDEISRLLEMAKQKTFDIVIGVGGGKTIDTAKAISFELNLPVVTVPTIASTDAPTTAVAVIYTVDGMFQRELYLPSNPVLVLVDTRIIAQAPVRFLVSGMGDALSTWFEAESCKNKYAVNLSGDHGSVTAYALSRLCYETLLEYGALAKAACENHSIIPALEHIIEANTLLSGLGCENAGLASAHSIADGLTELEPTHHYYHGEKVAIGTLASLFLTDKPKATIDEVFSFCESVSLPTTFADIGLAGVTDEELMKVAESTYSDKLYTKNEPIPVDPESVFFALKAVDAEGRKRKS
jgi:glycerol dehydrogenase